MAGDHQFFIRRNDVNGNGAVRGRDQLVSPSVRRLVEPHTQPGQLRGDSRTKRRGVLADARREDERVEAAKRRRERASEERNPVDEIVDRKGRARIAACFKLSHVIADAGQAFEPAIVVEQALRLLRAHALLLNEVEHNARIDLAGAGAHRQSIERRKAHRALDALPVLQRAHGGAAAQMGHDDPFLRNVRRNLRQARRDVFVREAVEAVAADALGMEMLRDRVVVGDGGVLAMEGRVEARDLGQPRLVQHDRPDRSQIVRLVQRREGDIAFEALENLLRDNNRPIEFRASMHDPVADGNRVDVTFIAKPPACRVQRRRNVRHGLIRVGPLDQNLPFRGLSGQMRLGPNAFNFTFELADETARLIDAEYLELDARRPGICNKDCVHDASRR